MKVIIFGATGMVGQGVLKECLNDGGVDLIVSVSRTATGLTNPRLKEILLADVSQLEESEAELAGADACFFPLGVSSAGMSEEAYSRVTHDLTLKIAERLARLNPGMTFVYVSGMGTDSTEKGRTMWARVKGRTENDLLRLPLRTFLFRPGFIQPLDGIRSRTPLYRLMYAVTGPLAGLARWIWPNQVLTTRQIGLAMLGVARKGFATAVLEARDIRQAAGE